MQETASVVGVGTSKHLDIQLQTIPDGALSALLLEAEASAAWYTVSTVLGLHWGQGTLASRHTLPLASVASEAFVHG